MSELSKLKKYLLFVNYFTIYSVAYLLYHSIFYKQGDNNGNLSHTLISAINFIVILFSYISIFFIKKNAKDEIEKEVVEINIFLCNYTILFIILSSLTLSYCFYSFCSLEVLKDQSFIFNKTNQLYIASAHLRNLNGLILIAISLSNVAKICNKTTFLLENQTSRHLFIMSQTCILVFQVYFLWHILV